MAELRALLAAEQLQAAGLQQQSTSLEARNQELTASVADLQVRHRAV